jgi:hypothetical protein
MGSLSRELDLHGLNRQDAFDLVEDELLKRSMRGSFDLTIITGNSKPMREGVIEVCERHGFSFYQPSSNLGQIIVSYIGF